MLLSLILTPLSNSNRIMPKAYYNRGYAKAELGQYDAAIADYDTAIQTRTGFRPSLPQSG